MTPVRFPDNKILLPKDSTDRIEVQASVRKDETYADILDYRGERVFAVTREIPGVNWVVVVKIDREEAYASVIQLYRMILLSLAALFLLLGFSAIHLRRHFIRPIQALTKTAKQIQRGTYHGELSVNVENEVGELAQAFKTMSDELLDANASLESKVKHRTSRLNRLLKDVREQKTRETALLSSLAEGMIATDKHGRVTYLNHAACEIFHCSSQDVLGSEVSSLLNTRTIQGKQLTKKDDPIEQVLRQDKQIQRRELQARRQTDELFPLLLSGGPVHVNDVCVGYMFLLQDISREKEVDKLKGEFISMASHQLRAPLASMNWYGELLASRKTGSLNVDQKKYVDRINISTRRTISLVDDFLNVSRLERGELKNVPKQTRVLDVVKKIIDIHALEIEQKDLDVQVVSKARRKIFMVDPDILTEVLANLTGNAVKYSPTKGVVRIQTQDIAGGLRIEIQDKGLGIPKEEQHKIFGKFYRGTNATKQGIEGTGLGLYTAMHLMERIGGKIGFESTENRGSTFWIELSH